MKKQELYNKVIAYFQEAMPVAETELHYNNPFELLIAVILSAQCTKNRSRGNLFYSHESSYRITC